MANPRARGRPAKLNTQAEQLQTALNFVSVASSDREIYHRFVRIAGNYVVAHNGQMAAGYPIAEALEVNPHLDRLKIAIAKCGKTLALTQTPTGKLSIKGEKITALVDGLPDGDLPTITPDPSCAVVTDVLKEAFRVCGVLASEAGFEVITASLLLEANVCSGTNRQVLMQFWHGIDLPPAMVIPKAFAAAVAKQTIALTGFGFGWDNQRQIVSSVTLWFDNGAWIKTQTYVDRWPDIARIMNVQTAPGDVPAGFFEAIAVVSEFNESGYVTLGSNQIQSHRSEFEGAQYEVPGIQPGMQLSGKLASYIAPYAAKIDLTTYPDRAFFFGGEQPHGIRGAIMGVVENSHGPAAEQTQTNQEEAEDDDAS